VNKINCKKATNEKVHPLLAVAMLFVIFSVSGSVINAYAQQFSGNRSSTRVDPAVESLENGQLLSTPGPSANDLGAPAEQTDNNQEEVANIEPELDEQEPASQDSTEVNEDGISSNIKQEGSQEEEEQSAGDEQESNSDEEDNNADESEKEEKNNIPLNFKATTGLPFP
jgi:hypothetical protein